MEVKYGLLHLLCTFTKKRCQNGLSENRKHTALLRAFLAASSPSECRRQTQHWLMEAQELSWYHGDG